MEKQKNVKRGNPRVGKILNDAINTKGWTRKKASEHCGTSTGNLSNLITGWSMPGRDVAIKIENEFGIKVTEWGVLEASAEIEKPEPVFNQIEFCEVIYTYSKGCTGCMFLGLGAGCSETMERLTGLDCNDDFVFKKRPSWKPCPIDIEAGATVKSKHSPTLYTVLSPPIKADCTFHGCMVVAGPDGTDELVDHINFEVEAA